MRCKTILGTQKEDNRLFSYIQNDRHLRWILSEIDYKVSDYGDLKIQRYFERFSGLKNIFDNTPKRRHILRILVSFHRFSTQKL